MAPTEGRSDPSRSLAALDRRHARLLLWTLGVLIIVYVVWIATPHRFSYSVLLNGWLPDIFEFVVAVLCIARAATATARKGAVIALGAGLLSWCLGDFVWTAQSVYGQDLGSNVVGALLWLGFYPLAYLAVVLLSSDPSPTVSAQGWMDGAVAGLGAAALCATFAFHSAGYSSNLSVLEKVTNLAYPIGDVLLLALIVAGTVVSSERRTGSWLLLAGSCTLNCIGDTFNLFQSTEGASRLDAVMHILAWPAAGLLMTTAVWMQRKPGPLRPRADSTSYVLPGLATVSGLVILVVATFRHVGTSALILAVAALAVAGIRLVWTAQNMRLLTAQLRRRSYTDELTGLDNRRYLFEVLERHLRFDQSSRQRLAFLFVDLDHFKEVNDSFGHLAGDELLRQIAPRFRACIPDSALVVRLGGDEFAAVLDDVTPEEAERVAEVLSETLQQPFEIGGVSAKVGASIGVALASGGGVDPSELLRRADAAMYRAKLAGSSTALYDEGLDDDYNPWSLSDELRAAIEAQDLVLYFQPQVCPRTGEVEAFEALVRWQHPHRGLLEPGRFLHLAEQAGLMPQLSALVLDLALRQLAEWLPSRPHLRLSINISASNLLDDGFLDGVRTLLEGYAVAPEAVVLEITETTVISNLETSKSVIEGLRRLGIAVSVDDFGAGFTALSYLSEFVADELKVDQRIVATLRSSRARDRGLVQSTIELGHALGMRVVAEGVEDAQTLEILCGLGADLIQGYHVGRPVPPGSVEFVGTTLSRV